MRKAPPTTDDRDDASLFRDAIGVSRGHVRVLPAATPPPSAPKPKPAAHMARRDEAAARNELQHILLSSLETGDVLRYRRDEINPQILKKLSRGEYAAQEELDLHGLPAQSAEILLRQVLRDCRLHGVGCVRIIHGKGTGALRRAVRDAIKKDRNVKSFETGLEGEGGDGVTVVKLKTE